MDFLHPIPATLSREDMIETFYGCLESSDDGFLIVDPAGRVAYINHAYCEYLNVQRGTVLGLPVKQVIDTSKMAEIALNPNYPPEHNVIHKVSSANQYRDGEHYCIVNRANVSINGETLASVAQIKFVQRTLSLSAALSDVYDELEYYKEELLRLSADKYSFQQILGHSKAMRMVKNSALKTINNDFPVLIQGETGTGKEIFASAIHYAGTRKHKPFIRINCAAIPSELLESELFGYEEGAFTGASKGGKKGKFELANGGTMFLDEIGDMPMVMQTKLLRVLQEGELEHVGGTKTIPIDVRVIAATNQNLIRAIEEKRFREDLYYRLNVIPLQLPPLRQHIEDIDEYIDAFLGELNQKYHTSVRITPEVRAKFSKYRWPGNVRELKNVLERSYAMRQGNLISSVSIPAGFHSPCQNFAARSLDEMMRQVEREILLDALHNNNGNIKKTAADLGIHRVTLYKKMEKLEISREIVHE